MNIIHVGFEYKIKGYYRCMRPTFGTLLVHVFNVWQSERVEKRLK